MAMTIAPVSASVSFDPQAAGAASRLTSAQGLSVAFQPQQTAGLSGAAGAQAPGAPLSSLGSDLAQRLEAFDKTRLDSRKASVAAAKDLAQGPASAGPSGEAAYARARAELAAGPASLRAGAAGSPSPGAAAANSGLYDRAFDAMRQSFDYAIETQMVVKTGSQFASSLNQLMRGQ
ncbi:hypothetical protein [Neomegalonema sp.]|uniref:hypothetical protein n=1 Tax=Neomegalonema sp. TaxID=2039713 RepID=UPI002609BAE1|nr:hypothetical protein [Neomegalonema sp.]MDD2868176.1 hypothetical protein [Neomegalonema sp.]